MWDYGWYSNSSTDDSESDDDAVKIQLPNIMPDHSSLPWFGTKSWVGRFKPRHWYGFPDFMARYTLNMIFTKHIPIGSTPCAEGKRPGLCYKGLNERLEEARRVLPEWKLTPEERAEFDTNEFGLTIEPQEEEGLEMVDIMPLCNDPRMSRELSKKFWRTTCKCDYCPLRECRVCDQVKCENCFHPIRCDHIQITLDKRCPRHAYEAWKYVTRLFNYNGPQSLVDRCAYPAF